MQAAHASTAGYQPKHWPCRAFSLPDGTCLNFCVCRIGVGKFCQRGSCQAWYQMHRHSDPQLPTGMAKSSNSKKFSCSCSSSTLAPQPDHAMTGYRT
jgi:hypothetical protein